jgi:hypothetical protein
MAQIYALLGDVDHAIPVLRRLLEIPFGDVITPALLRLDPIWDSIRNDPRFQELAQKRNREFTKNSQAKSTRARLIRGNFAVRVSVAPPFNQRWTHSTCVRAGC